MARTNRTLSNRQKANLGLGLAGVFVSISSYLIIFPLAAWNHNVPLIVASVIAPLAFAQFMVYRAGKTLFVGLFTTQTGIKFLMLTVFGILFWNHQWFLAMLLLGIEIFINSKMKK